MQCSSLRTCTHETSEGTTNFLQRKCRFYGELQTKFDLTLVCWSRGAIRDAIRGIPNGGLLFEWAAFQTGIMSSERPSTYISDRLCWLHGPALYFGFLVPAGVCLIANCFGFFFIIRAISKGRKKVSLFLALLLVKMGCRKYRNLSSNSFDKSFELCS